IFSDRYSMIGHMILIVLLYLFVLFFFFFFFFQAEDGIRDRNVTGVQTCALPISRFGTERDCQYQSVLSLQNHRKWLQGRVSAFTKLERMVQKTRQLLQLHEEMSPTLTSLLWPETKAGT